MTVAVPTGTSTRENLAVFPHPAPITPCCPVVKEGVMQVVYPRCGGLDVHKRSVVACVLLTQPDGMVQRHTRTFGAMTADLLALADWLTRLGVTHVAIES